MEEVFITNSETGLCNIFILCNTRGFPQSTYTRKLVSTSYTVCNLGSDKNRRCALGNYRLGNSLQDILHDKNVDTTFAGVSAMFQVPFTKQERVDNYRDFMKCKSICKIARPFDKEQGHDR